jgi:hypothetical protein
MANPHYGKGLWYRSEAKTFSFVPLVDEFISYSLRAEDRNRNDDMLQVVSADVEIDQAAADMEIRLKKNDKAFVTMFLGCSPIAASSFWWQANRRYELYELEAYPRDPERVGQVIRLCIDELKTVFGAIPDVIGLKFGAIELIPEEKGQSG